MSRVLVTGGTGTLGRALVPALRAAGHDVSVLSRSAGATTDPDVPRRVGDLRTGAGLDEAVRGVDAVVHLASDGRHAREVDVDGTARLSGAAATAGCTHLLLISIVGCDAIPFSYYRAKTTAEHVALAGPVPASVLRATQFHELVVRFAQAVTLGPVAVVPRGLRFAPVDVRDVAERLVRAVTEGPQGRLPDLGGPDVVDLADVAASWARARGRRRPRVVRPPAWGRLLSAHAAGANLPGPQAERGRRTLEAWVADHAPAAAH
jgi:uncharacterized protein YbjT (DUF2867 family)